MTISWTAAARLKVPRFYFNLFNDLVVRDEEGVELPSLHVVQEEARKGAVGVIGEQQAAAGPNHRINVEDEQRRAVYTLHFREVISRILL